MDQDLGLKIRLAKVTQQFDHDSNTPVFARRNIIGT